jgi:hypothetical protein
MIVVTILGRLGSWLTTSLTDVDVQHTAVGMVVESMSFGSDLTSWRSSEKLGSDIGEKGHAANSYVVNIWEDGRFEEIDSTVRVLVIDLLLKSGIEWGESIVIEIAKDQLLDIVDESITSGSWFVQWIKTKNILI